MKERLDGADKEAHFHPPIDHVGFAQITERTTYASQVGTEARPIGIVAARDLRERQVLARAHAEQTIADATGPGDVDGGAAGFHEPEHTW